MDERFKTDGHVTHVSPYMVVPGTILRMVSESEGTTPPFSDTTVTCISTIDKAGNKRTYPTLEEAINAAGLRVNGTGVSFDGPTGEYVVVHLARPYVYANTIGICVGHLMGCEVYTATADAIIRMYKVVTMSTGKAAVYNNRNQHKE